MFDLCRYRKTEDYLSLSGLLLRHSHSKIGDSTDGPVHSFHGLHYLPSCPSISCWQTGGCRSTVSHKFLYLLQSGSLHPMLFDLSHFFPSPSAVIIQWASRASEEDECRHHYPSPNPQMTNWARMTAWHWWARYLLVGLGLTHFGRPKFYELKSYPAHLSHQL